MSAEIEDERLRWVLDQPEAAAGVATGAWFTSLAHLAAFRALEASMTFGEARERVGPEARALLDRLALDVGL